MSINKKILMITKNVTRKIEKRIQIKIFDIIT
jgi:hypothetical protein